MVWQAQSRLEDRGPSLVVPHSVQHLGTLGGTKTLAGPENPVLILHGYWVHMAWLVLQGQESLGQDMFIMSSPGQAVGRLHIASCGPPFPVGPGF